MVSNLEEINLADVIKLDKAIREDEKEEKEVVSPGEVVSAGDVQLSLTGGGGTFSDAMG